MSKSNLIDNDHLSIEANKENIPVNRYIQAFNEQKKAQYFKIELKKAINYLLDNFDDRDTFELNIEIVIKKLTDVVKHEVKSEIIKENWRVS